MKTSKHQARRVVGYVRISRDREDETSTTTQRQAIEAYCTVHGWTLVDVIVEPGRSAFKHNRNSRPGFKAAMSLIAGGVADTFVVWKLDRAARNTLDLLKFVREDLATYDAEFVSTTESFDTTTAMGRAMLTIVSALAEMESAQKSDRAKAWHDHRRQNGAVPAGLPPIGYVKPRPNVIELDVNVAPLVREAAHRIVRGESINSTVKFLNGAGVSITRPGLLTLLQSPTLAGLVSVELLDRRSGARVVGDDATLVPGDWEPLLDRDVWENVRMTLAAPTGRVSHGNTLRHPLVPIIRCECGGRMRVQADHRKYGAPRYVCGPTGCGNGIGQGPVDEAVTATVLDHLDEATWRNLRANGSAGGPDPAVVERKLADLWQMVLAEKIDPEEYAEAKTVWRGQLAAVERDPIDLPDVDDVRTAWEGFGAAEKHLVFRGTIGRLVIGKATRRGRGVDLTRVDLRLIIRDPSNRPLALVVTTK